MSLQAEGLRSEECSGVCINPQEATQMVERPCGQQDSLQTDTPEGQNVLDW